MAKNPAFLFYPGDWIGGTMYFTFEQKGAYMELLILQFNVGKFTENQAKKVLRENQKIWDEIKCKFSEKNGLFFNKRLQNEVEKRAQHSEKQKENIRKRWNRVGNTTVLPLETENENRSVNGIEIKDRGVGEELVYDAQKEILKNEIWFEQICMNTGKSIDEGKDCLRKFHLYMEENSKYPRTKRAICAGFEKWLLNEKSINGSTTHQRTSQNGSGKKGTSDARIDALRKW